MNDKSRASHDRAVHWTDHGAPAHRDNLRIVKRMLRDMRKHDRLDLSEVRFAAIVDDLRHRKSGLFFNHLIEIDELVIELREQLSELTADGCLPSAWQT